MSDALREQVKALVFDAICRGDVALDTTWDAIAGEYTDRILALLAARPAAGEGEALPRCGNGIDGRHWWDFTDFAHGDEEVECDDCGILARLVPLRAGEER